MEGIAKVGKIAAIGLAAAGAAAVAFGVSSVKSFNESQKVAAQLDAVLKSTNQAAGVTKERALDLAAALQKQTTFSDEAVLSAENMLLTFTNIKDNVFPEATKTVLDMSTALGQDTKASAIQLGKALNDPILGVTALRRVGVAFTEDQQKQIQVLVESGKTLDAQKMILKELATEFGGSAAAQAQTFAGKIEQMKNNFDDLKEVVGGFLVDYLNPLLQALSTGLSNVPAIVQSIKDKWAAVTAETSVLGQFLSGFFIPLWTVVRDAVVTAWTDIKTALEPIMPQLKIMAQFLGVVIVGAIMVLITAFAGIIVIVAKVVSGAIKLWAGMISGMTNGLTSLIGVFSRIGQAIKDSIGSAIEWVLSKLNKVIAGYNKVVGVIGGKSISEISAKQYGGSVGAGQMALVGEHRPEIFVPSQSGNIRQLSQVGGGAVNVTVNVAGDVSSRQSIDAIIEGVTKALNRKQELTRMGA